MSNVTQFFPAGSVSVSPGRAIRQIFKGPGSYTWYAPPSTTQVEVHCWGGGGNGGSGPPSSTGGSGGGGGGYIRHLYPVVGGVDILSITVGGQGGTTSITVPTQTPTSPISATGGSSGTNGPGPTAVPGGAGGTASFTIAPGISTAFTFVASGGSGGNSGTAGASGGGGGSSGSIYGNGNAGGTGGAPLGAEGHGGGGGGLFSAGVPASSPTNTGKGGSSGDFLLGSASKWYYIEEFFAPAGGNGGIGTAGDPSAQKSGTPVDAFAGAGGGCGQIPVPPAAFVPGNAGGSCIIVGGGGGNGTGGGPVGSTGGVGLVVLYFDQ